VKRVYNVIITSNSGDFVKSYSISHSRWKLIRFLICLLAIVLLASALFYGRLYVLALKSRALEVENEKLREENAKVQELEKQLYAIEELRVKISSMLGVEATPSLESAFNNVDSKISGVKNFQALPEAYKKVSSEFQQYGELLFDEERYVPSGVPVEGFISQKYGNSHKGLDFVTPIGTPVKATADGIVKNISEDRFLGLVLTISHGSKYETLYGHLKEILVKRGKIVKKGDVIALSGNSGISTGPHLHYEIRYLGEHVDPINYLY